MIPETWTFNDMLTEITKALNSPIIATGIMFLVVLTLTPYIVRNLITLMRFDDDGPAPKHEYAPYPCGQCGGKVDMYLAELGQELCFKCQELNYRLEQRTKTQPLPPLPDDVTRTLKG